MGEGRRREERVERGSLRWKARRARVVGSIAEVGWVFEGKNTSSARKSNRHWLPGSVGQNARVRTDYGFFSQSALLWGSKASSGIGT